MGMDYDDFKVFRQISNSLEGIHACLCELVDIVRRDVASCETHRAAVSTPDLTPDVKVQEPVYAIPPDSESHYQLIPIHTAYGWQMVGSQYVGPICLEPTREEALSKLLRDDDPWTRCDRYGNPFPEKGEGA